MLSDSNLPGCKDLALFKIVIINQLSLDWEVLAAMQTNKLDFIFHAEFMQTKRWILQIKNIFATCVPALQILIVTKIEISHGHWYG